MVINGHSLIGQRLFCYNVSVILSAAILPSEFRINKGSILERFYLTREIIAAQLYANECQFHGVFFIVMAFFDLLLQ